MIYLIGVDHKIQHSANLTKRKKKLLAKFRSYLEDQIKQLEIELLAEEFSAHAVKLCNVTESTLQSIAKRIGIEHRFCDPDLDERAALGISKSDFDKRELEWVKRINKSSDRNVLFLCGGNHIVSFMNLLKDSGILVELISDGWGDELVGENIFEPVEPDD